MSLPKSNESPEVKKISAVRVQYVGVLQGCKIVWPLLMVAYRPARLTRLRSGPWIFLHFFLKCRRIS